MSNDSHASQSSASASQVIPTLSTIVWRSLVRFRAMHFALALGIAAATAVIVGALIVGDSVRGSLKELVVERLGNIEFSLVSQRFFDPAILAGTSTGIGAIDFHLEPMIVMPSVSVELRRDGQLRRAAQVQAFGTEPTFWQASPSGAVSDGARSTASDTTAVRPRSFISLAADEVALNATLAAELRAEVGDEITLRLPKGTGVPADSPLGRRDDTSASLPRQRVAAILPDHSVADLDFRAGQQATRNLFLPLLSLQEALEQPGKINAAVVVAPRDRKPHDYSHAQALCDRMNERIAPKLEDYGLRLTRHTRVFPDTNIGEQADLSGKPDAANQPDVAKERDTATETRSTEPKPTTEPKPSTEPNPSTEASDSEKDEAIGAESVEEQIAIFDYYQITSDQLILDDLSQKLLYQGLQPLNAQRSMTYLVNEIATYSSDGVLQPTKVTYSIAIGMEDWDTLSADFSEGLVLWDQRPASCAVNSWLAERLKLNVGSMLKITYFKPETVDGREVEMEQHLLVNQIVPVTAPAKGFVRNRPARFDRAPTPFNDPDLTPVVPGITDQDSISKWDLPFKLTREVPKEDDQYWEDYRLTPKLFLKYNTATRFFGSRFGSATAMRIDATQADEDQIRQLATKAMLDAKPALGMQFQPIRQAQLQAASGTTPFDGLFLALSFFVIVAALMLVALLFRLSIEQRAGQWGLLIAAGFSYSRVRSLLLRESGVVVAAGVLIGILLGLGYARLMIAGLESWWVGAISASFLHFYFTPRSLLIGAAIGGAASLFTILWSLWRLDRKEPLDLLRGRWDTQSRNALAPNNAPLAIAGFLFFGAMGLLTLGLTQSGMAQAGSFFGCGMLLLSAALVASIYVLKYRVPAKSEVAARPGLWSLAWLALTRNPWRSVLSVGLLSVASFLIASLSLFQVSPNLQGSGGFELMAESSLPIYRDISSTRVREELLSKEDFQTLRSANVISFRSRMGEDASCNNLYQVAQPTVLGVPDALAQYEIATPKSHQFQWAAQNAKREIPWQDLGQIASGTREDPVPVIMDLNTAAWSLHQGASLDAVTVLKFDERVVYFRTVGLLSNSILQGKLMIGEANFGQLFPEISGDRYFLIQSNNLDQAAVSSALENGWSDQGLDVTSTQEALAKLLAVQNTYISAFQSIGALGLLLGTVGLAVVQVRSVLERRRELALMQALGFSRLRIAYQLLCESAILLAGGVLVGVTAASIAIVPYMLSGNSQLDLLQPIVLLSIVLVVGLAASLIAVVIALRQPLLTNLQ